MSGHKQTPSGVDRGLIADALTALRGLDLATRTDSGLAKRAGQKGRVTLKKVLKAEPVRDDTLMKFDDALQVPTGTLKRIGESVPFRQLGLTDEQVRALELLPRPHPSGATRNRKAV